jgi:hypothetical protein
MLCFDSIPGPGTFVGAGRSRGHGIAGDEGGVTGWGGRFSPPPTTRLLTFDVVTVFTLSWAADPGRLGVMSQAQERVSAEADRAQVPAKASQLGPSSMEFALECSCFGLLSR